MSWVRFTTNQYYIPEDHSFDSDSEETGRQYAAFFSVVRPAPPKIAKPTATDLSSRQHILQQQFPECTLEINALAYYYGLFTPSDHLAHNPQFTRFFDFFNPDQQDMSHKEISLFKNDLKEYSRQPI